MAVEPRALRGMVPCIRAMDASTEAQLDERAATELMGWVRGGPDLEFWCLGHPPPGLTSIFRMPVTRWRPTRDAFCLELLVEEMRSHGLTLEVAERQDAKEGGFTCMVSGGATGRPPVTVSAPTAGVAVVCAALAHRQGGA